MITLFKKILSVFILFLLVGLIAHSRESNAQVIIQFNGSNDNNLNFQSVWGFTLNNLSGNVLSSYTRINITNSQMEPLITILSPQIELNNGENIPTNEIIKNSRIDFNNNNPTSTAIKKDGYFPKGLYYICIVVRDAKSDAELGQNCTQANITIGGDTVNPKTNEDKKPNFFSKNVKLSGYSEITGVYSNMQAYGSTIDPSYVQWYLNPTVSVFDFPVSMQLLLSTRQNNNQQNINSFNVQFDANQFLNMLRQRATDFIKQKLNTDKLNNINLESFTGQLNDVKSKLSNPGALQEIEQLKQLDSLKQSMSDLDNIGKDSASIFNQIEKLKKISGNDSLKMDTSIIRSKLDSLNSKRDSLVTAKKDSLKKKIKVLSWLEEKKPYYDKLMKQKDELESKLKNVNLDSLTGKIDEYKSKYDPQKLSDPNYLYGFLGKFNLFKKFEKIMMAVKKFSIGTSYPSYSDFTFKGVQVNGFNMEIEKWNTSLSFTYGTALEGIVPSGNYSSTANTNTVFTYKRNVIGGSIGYGSREKSHIHFTLLSFEDDPSSIYVPDSMIGIAPRPKSNQVMSIDFKVKFLKNKLSFFGELAGSQTIRDITLIDSSFLINTTNYNNPREWFPNIFLQRTVDLNTSVDFAFKAGAEISLFKGNTKVSAQVKRVGPGFTSFGNPFMMRDLFNIETKISQSFWKKRIQISGFLRRNIDNLENTKLLTSQLYNFGFDLTLNIPKWPSLRVSMTPYVQSNDSSNINVNVVTANTNYLCKIKKLQLMTNLSYMHQNGTSSDSAMDFYSHYITLLNTLLISKSVSLNLTQNYFHINNRYGEVGTYSLNISGSFIAFKKWNSTIGGILTTNQNERRYGGYYQTGISFLKYFSINVRFEYSRYDIINLTPYNSNMPFDQVYLRGVLITRW